MDDDILEWARDHLSVDGEPFKLAPWQERIARVIYEAEPGTQLFISLPRMFGRGNVLSAGEAPPESE